MAISIKNGGTTNNTGLGDSVFINNTTGDYNTAVGYESLANNTTGKNNTAVGYQSLDNNTTGNDNTAVGYQSLANNTTGNRNSGLGYLSLYTNTTGNTNVAFGWLSLQYNTTGNNNVGIGAYALYQNSTGSDNVGVGRNALGNQNSNYCTAVGQEALYNIGSNPSGCVGIGRHALRSAGAITGLIDCTAVGNNALSSAAGGASNCTAIGARTVITGEQNTTCLGFGATSGSSNEIVLGNSSIIALRCAQQTIFSLSDIRDKENIEDIPVGLDYINELRPVMFDWNRRDGSFEGKKDFGFIAQELDLVEQKFGYAEYTKMIYKQYPDKWEASPMQTYPILIKAIQELSAKVNQLQNELDALK